MTKVNQADQDDSEATPQYLHRRKLIEEADKRKKATVEVETNLEVISDPYHKHGGKVRLVKRLKNGNVHRLYLGREKQVAGLISKYKARGVKIVR